MADRTDFLKKALRNVENIDQKPVAGTPKYEHAPSVEYNPMVTDFDLSQYSEDKIQEQDFKATVAVYLNLSMGQSNPAAKKKIRNKVAKAYKDNRMRGIDAVYQALRQLDPELEQEMKSHLLKKDSSQSSDNPL